MRLQRNKYHYKSGAYTNNLNERKKESMKEWVFRNDRSGSGLEYRENLNDKRAISKGIEVSGLEVLVERILKDNGELRDVVRRLEQQLDDEKYKMIRIEEKLFEDGKYGIPNENEYIREKISETGRVSQRNKFEHPPIDSNTLLIVENGWGSTKKGNSELSRKNVFSGGSEKYISTLY